MKRISAVFLVVGLVAVAAGAQGMMGGNYGAPYGGDNSSNDLAGPGYGYGMMGGGYGMMGGGPFGGTQVFRPPMSIDEARAQADKYLSFWNDPDLEVSEIMEFSNHFYVSFREKGTKTGAFEMLMDKYSGAMRPEPGPDMMWNLKYGMMSRGGAASVASGEVMPLALAEADADAQKYLDSFGSALKAEDGGDKFYGYYTIHVLNGGKIVGMLGVNGFTGQVWYHGWHGDFIGMKTYD